MLTAPRHPDTDWRQEGGREGGRGNAEARCGGGVLTLMHLRGREGEGRGNIGCTVRVMVHSDIETYKQG